MSSRLTRNAIRTALAALVLAAIVVATWLVLNAVEAHAATRPPAHSARACAGSATKPSPRTIRRLQLATLCLMNRERRLHGRSSLRLNPRLTLAAAAHSRDMVRHNYFSHVTPGGVGFVSRILRYRYATWSQPWALGENIGAGTGRLSTPAAMVAGWMHSPGHRAILLGRSYRVVGVGLALGSPLPSRRGATYTADFGETGK